MPYQFFRSPFFCPNGYVIVLRVDGTVFSLINAGGRPTDGVTIYNRRDFRNPAAPLRGDSSSQAQVSWSAYGAVAPDFALSHAHLIQTAAEVAARLNGAVNSPGEAPLVFDAAAGEAEFTAGDTWAEVTPAEVDEMFARAS